MALVQYISSNEITASDGKLGGLLVGTTTKSNLTVFTQRNTLLDVGKI